MHVRHLPRDGKTRQDEGRELGLDLFPRGRRADSCHRRDTETVQSAQTMGISWLACSRWSIAPDWPASAGDFRMTERPRDEAVEQHPVFLKIKAQVDKELERERSAGARCLIERALEELAEQLTDIQSCHDNQSGDTFYRDMRLDLATLEAKNSIQAARFEDEVPEGRHRSELSLARYETYVEGFQDGYRRRGLLNVYSDSQVAGKLRDRGRTYITKTPAATELIDRDT